MKLKLLFAWYDLWVGFFWDKKKQTLYVLPLPTVGFTISFLPVGWYVEYINDGKQIILYHKYGQYGTLNSIKECREKAWESEKNTTEVLKNIQQ